MNNKEEVSPNGDVKAISIKASEFEGIVVQSSIPVLVDWWAPWCGPCKMLAPTMDKLAKEFNGIALVVKIDCEDNLEMASKMNIKALPTVTVWSNGKESGRIAGLRSVDDYRNMINSAIDNSSSKI
jgi:thioredoxin 1